MFYYDPFNVDDNNGLSHVSDVWTLVKADLTDDTWMLEFCVLYMPTHCFPLAVEQMTHRLLVNKTLFSATLQNKSATPIHNTK